MLKNIYNAINICFNFNKVISPDLSPSLVNYTSKPFIDIHWPKKKKTLTDIHWPKRKKTLTCKGLVAPSCRKTRHIQDISKHAL